MAANIPNALKSADIARFVSRAAQVERAKPAIAYWCNYWIVQQIVTKNLHNADGESQAYTTSLLEKLETVKTEHANDDAITDDLAGQASVEHFGLEVFQRADNAIRANKASKQTADTFQAAYTFLELLQIWPPLDPEIAAKIKFAKFHALRIAKAIKAGEDPNLSNPTPDTTPLHEQAPALDPQDPEVRAIQGGVPSASASTIGSPVPLPPQPPIEGILDEHDAQQRPSPPSSVPHGLAPAQDPHVEDFYHGTTAANGDVSPLGPPSMGYFPRVTDESSGEPARISPPQVMQHSQYAAPTQQPQVPHIQSPPFVAGLQAPHQQTTTMAPPGHHAYGRPSPLAQEAPPQQQYLPHESTIVDEEAIAKAQKHARWAISALNYEDMPTAVKELREALKTLGAGKG